MACVSYKKTSCILSVLKVVLHPFYFVNSLYNLTCVYYIIGATTKLYRSVRLTNIQPDSFNHFMRRMYYLRSFLLKKGRRLLSLWCNLAPHQSRTFVNLRKAYSTLRIKHGSNVIILIFEEHVWKSFTVNLKDIITISITHVNLIVF